MTSTTKKDIVNTIAAQMQLKQSVVNEVVQRTFDAIIESSSRRGPPSLSSPAWK